MANAVTDAGVKSYGEGEIDYLTDTIKIALMSGTVPSATTDSIIMMSDLITAGNTIISEATMASKTIADRELGGADLTFTAVSGAAITFAMQYKDTGTTTTSRLIAQWDTANTGTGLSTFPITPNGLDISVSFADGPSKIYSL